MLIYLISSIYETERFQHIQQIKQLFPNLVQIEAIYPSKIKVPFLNKIKTISAKRNHRALSNGEIGCLLSHRKAWQYFLNQNDDNECLILESDSLIVDPILLIQHFNKVHSKFDLFFWGAFDGRMQLLKSSKERINSIYSLGNPLVNSLYCTYGYSINKVAAKCLLQQTRLFDYPIDYWKRRLKGGELTIGGVHPNLISTVGTFNSNIRTGSKKISTIVFDWVVDVKNVLISNLR